MSLLFQASKYAAATLAGESVDPVISGSWHWAGLDWLARKRELYVSLGCPWASRTVTVRALKGLEEAVGLSVVDPIRDIKGWAFREGPGDTGDPINGFEYLSEAYQRSYPGYDDRYSVPVLWDRATGQIVNNESSEIIVMLNGAFNEWAEHPEVDLYPAHLRAEIDALNDWVYSGLNNGVYRTGFASSQTAYDEAVGPVFETLDRMDALLAGRRYLAGSQHTLADWRAFPTLMRFDLVYHGLFRCNRRRLIDYDNLWPYLPTFIRRRASPRRSISTTSSAATT